jgi:hypothetical protein
MAEGYKNFDDAIAEKEERTTKFTLAGEDFEVNLNVKAGPLLRWMESASRVEGIPKLLQLFLDEEDYQRLLDTDADWDRLEALVVWLAQELGDSGN